MKSVFSHYGPAVLNLLVSTLSDLSFYFEKIFLGDKTLESVPEDCVSEPYVTLTYLRSSVVF